jgi:glycosyltransferase involved in cell wall biosynthesis
VKKIIIVTETQDYRYYIQPLSYLKANGYDVYFVNLYNKNHPCRDIKKILDDNHFLVLPASCNYWQFIFFFRRILIIHKPEIVHAHMFHVAFYVALGKLLSPIRFKMIYHKHNNESSRLIEKLFESVVLLFTDKTIAISNAVKQTVQKNIFFKRNTAHLIFNGIAVNKESIDGYTKGDQQYILFLGRLREEKGHIFLFNCFKSLIETHPNIQLVCAGDGPFRNVLEEWIGKYNLHGKIMLIGNQEDIKSIIDKSEFMVMPSKKEPFGLTCIEGMACGKLVLASDVDGLKDIIVHGYDGELLAFNDESLWIQRMRFYLDNKTERDFIASNAIKSYQKRFTPEVMAANYIQLYQLISNER